MAEVTLRVRIRGQVQGVFFRQTTLDQARRLGVRGWVANRSDGSVEALVAGPADAVQRLVDWAHRGPEPATVDSVETTEDPEAEVPAGFEVRSVA